ncbi:hypothetical protein RRF57_000174 [Xylaria bambusicola]|uniref:Uncharacterized protein n=1 Tax=Xylaria bambusicola TaxID=326684 RepID=A0AAN7Z296_9PEZI
MIVLDDGVAFLDIFVWLARVDGPVSEISVDALQISQQVRPVVDVALAWVARSTELANPYRGYVTLDKVRPVLAHGLDERGVAALSKPPLSTSPAGPSVDMGGVDDSVLDIKHHWACPRTREVVARFCPLDYDQPVSVNP